MSSDKQKSDINQPEKLDTNATILDESSHLDSVAPVDSVAAAEILPDDQKVQVLKGKIINYFEMINQRDWSRVNSIFGSNVYYLGSTISPAQILTKLENYWGQ